MLETMIGEAAKGLLVSGPLALVLGVACVVLWKKLTTTQDEFVKFLRDVAKGDTNGDGKPG